MINKKNIGAKIALSVCAIGSLFCLIWHITGGEYNMAAFDSACIAVELALLMLVNDE